MTDRHLRVVGAEETGPSLALDREAVAEYAHHLEMHSATMMLTRRGMRLVLAVCDEDGTAIDTDPAATDLEYFVVRAEAHYCGTRRIKHFGRRTSLVAVGISDRVHRLAMLSTPEHRRLAEIAAVNDLCNQVGWS